MHGDGFRSYVANKQASSKYPVGNGNLSEQVLSHELSCDAYVRRPIRERRNDLESVEIKRTKNWRSSPACLVI